jgi:uncharacterized membrane protein HdeD (DUF308 family)
MAAMPLRTKIGLVIGAVMFALGAYVALHPLWNRAPVTASRFLDLAFATFFLVKGWLYLRQAWRRPAPPSPGASTSQDGD